MYNKIPLNLVLWLLFKHYEKVTYFVKFLCISTNQRFFRGALYPLFFCILKVLHLITKIQFLQFTSTAVAFAFFLLISSPVKFIRSSRLVLEIVGPNWDRTTSIDLVRIGMIRHSWYGLYQKKSFKLRDLSWVSQMDLIRPIPTSNILIQKQAQCLSRIWGSEKPYVSRPNVFSIEC